MGWMGWMGWRRSGMRDAVRTDAAMDAWWMWTGCGAVSISAAFAVCLSVCRTLSLLGGTTIQRDVPIARRVSGLGVEASAIEGQQGSLAPGIRARVDCSPAQRPPHLPPPTRSHTLQPAVNPCNPRKSPRRTFLSAARARSIRSAQDEFEAQPVLCNCKRAANLVRLRDARRRRTAPAHPLPAHPPSSPPSSPPPFPPPCRPLPALPSPPARLPPPFPTHPAPQIPPIDRPRPRGRGLTLILMAPPHRPPPPQNPNSISPRASLCQRWQWRSGREARGRRQGRRGHVGRVGCVGRGWWSW
ncbi:hypothetical protein FA95DRAFT_985245 [Auriscalpium vulgare]|uniref:Uncharacterized protein n=1 Tax=Auriscalpium vulgare TaxID=40419 RepID=A0ACB8RXW2_9AGAM|nr:hypothetical protein FA95DRAFT_985245 [Auriscalpium vulgare]